MVFTSENLFSGHFSSKNMIFPSHKEFDNALYNGVMKFWIQNSIDEKFGGYFTCLDEEGKIYDDDKFVWLQARQVYMFSKLYNSSSVLNEDQKKEYLRIALLGAKFLEEKCHDKEGNFYFSLTREGKPLIQPYNIFSDCFVAMAMAQFAKASELKWAKERALKTFENIEKRKKNPKGKYNKSYPNSRNMISLSVFMIDINLCLEMKEVLPNLPIEERIKKNLEIIFEKFYYKEKGVFMESVMDNKEKKHFDTRLIDPGHILECCWFIMDVLETTLEKKDEYMKTTLSVVESTLNLGWDKKYKGLFYFMDIEGKPLDKLEWSQKLWWVHLEALICVAKAYVITKSEVFSKWFKTLKEYTWKHFYTKDEFWGYLDRRGEVLIRQKGGKWKGCFHVPRALFILSNVMKQIHSK